MPLELTSVPDTALVEPIRAETSRESGRLDVQAARHHFSLEVLVGRSLRRASLMVVTLIATTGLAIRWTENEGVRNLVSLVRGHVEVPRQYEMTGAFAVFS
jgi:hypothetical protein